MGVRIFGHIAVDDFSAEAYQRFHSRLSEQERPRHWFFWLGEGTPPIRDRLWSEESPDWVVGMTFEPSSVQGANGFDRNARAQIVRESVERGEIRRVLEAELTEAAIRRFGAHEVPEPSITICGSAGCAHASATVLGLLSGLTWLRGTGTWSVQPHLVMGIGAASAGREPDPAKTRAQAGQVLADLEAYLIAGKMQRVSDLRAAPIYLVGERGPGGAPLEIAGQIALGSIALSRICASELRPGRAGPGWLDPFEFRRLGDGDILHGNQRYDPFAPFAVLGGYRVWSDGERLLKVVAASVCVDLLDSMQSVAVDGAKLPAFWAREKDDSSLKRLIDPLERFLHQSVLAVEREPEKAVEGDFDDSGIWDFRTLEPMIPRLSGTPAWRRLIDAFGEARIQRLPMKRWTHAAADLREAVEGSILPERESDLKQVERVLGLRLLRSLDEAMGRLFTREAGRAHRAAAVFMGQVISHLDTAREAALEIQRAEDPPDIEAARQTEGRLRHDFAQVLETVPSPVAVSLRILPVFVVGLLAGQVLPRIFQVEVSPTGTLLAGTVVGVVAAMGIWYRWVLGVRKRVIGAFREWLGSYERLVELEDETARQVAFDGIYQTFRSLLVWAWDGSGEAPLPGDQEALLRTPVADPLNPFGEGGDRLSLQAALGERKEAVSTSRESFRTVESLLLQQYQESSVELALPALSGRRTELLRPIKERVLGREGESKFLAGIGTRGIAPYLSSRGSHTWRRRFVLPDGDASVGEGQVEANSGYGFFEGVLRHLRGLDLPEATLGGILQGREGSGASSSRPETGSLRAEVLTRFRSRVALSARVVPRPEALEENQLLVAPKDLESLANELSDKNDRAQDVTSENKEEITLIRVMSRLDAKGVTYYPNPDAPIEPLGLACRARHREGWASAELEPLTFTPEVE